MTRGRSRAARPYVGNPSTRRYAGSKTPTTTAIACTSRRQLLLIGDAYSSGDAGFRYEASRSKWNPTTRKPTPSHVIASPGRAVANAMAKGRIGEESEWGA